MEHRRCCHHPPPQLDTRAVISNFLHHSTHMVHQLTTTKNAQMHQQENRPLGEFLMFLVLTLNYDLEHAP